MGGLAGHMNHLIDYEYLNAIVINDIINDAFKGKLIDVKEKFDGFNIFVGTKNGQVIFARNPKEIENGIIPEEKWKNKPEILNKYLPGIQIIRNILPNLPEGYFINCECIVEGITNIIKYPKNFVVFHCIYEYEGTTLKNILQIPPELESKLNTENSSTGNYLTFIGGGDRQYLINYINKILGEDTIEEHCYKRFKEIVKAPEQASKALFERVFRTYPLRSLRKIADPDTIKYCETNKKQIREYIYRLLKQFQTRFEDEIINLYTGYTNTDFPTYILNRLPEPLPVPLKNTEGLVCCWENIQFKCTGGFAIANQVLHDR